MAGNQYVNNLYKLAGNMGIARSRDSASQRYYLKQNIEPRQFFEFINKSTTYVVLRWAETFPDHWKEGNDLDILVKDSDIDKILKYCTKEKSAYAIDIYSDGYRRGFIYSNSPYLPSKICSRLFKSRRIANGLVYVPGSREYVLTFFFHLLIHKGEKSGLGLDHFLIKPTEFRTRYLQEAIRLNREVYTCFPTDMDGYTSFSASSIYSCLSNHDWLPNLSMIRHFALSNRLLRELLMLKAQICTENFLTDAVTFIIRQRALTLGLIPRIEETIRQSGFQIVDSSEIHPAMIQNATSEIRSGNWEQNDRFLRKSGGTPRHVIVCLDYNPVYKCYAGIGTAHPFALNKNLSIKHRIRKSIERSQLFWQQAHLIHSSDDKAEALEYINECYEPKKSIEIISQINQFETSYRPHHSRFASLTLRGRRSHVYLCVKNGTIVVRKDYRPDKLKNMYRELLVYTHSSPLSFVPRFIGFGENFIEYAFVEGATAAEIIKSSSGRSLVRELVKAIMKESYEAGIALLDLSPSNLLIDGRGKGWVIDYEYAFKYGVDKPEGGFLRGYDYAGLPDYLDVDNPVGEASRGRSYDNTWLEHIGPL